MPPPRKQAQVVDGRFTIRTKLGQGSFGDIFEVNDQQSNRIFACKLEPINAKHPQLEWEILVYRAISKPPPKKTTTGDGSKQPQGFPRVHLTGKTPLNSRNKLHHYRYMVMDRLGKSLEDLYNLCDRRFSIKTICMIGIQLISRVEHLHAHNYIHRDIKPDNFLIGAGTLQSKHAMVIHVIDFGLCKKYTDEKGRHIKYKEGKRLTGTPRYASINTHNGIEQSRRDDLESLGYMLIYFSRKKLPWQGLKAQTKQEKYTKIGSRKMKTPLTNLCEGMPKQFITYLEYVRGLKFDQTPDYKYLRHLFFEIMREVEQTIDWVFDWNLLGGKPVTVTKPSRTTAGNRKVHAAPRGQPRGTKRQREPECVDLTSEKDDGTPRPPVAKRTRTTPPATSASIPKSNALAVAWRNAYNAMEAERDKYKVQADNLRMENQRLKQENAQLRQAYGGKPLGDPPDNKRPKA